MNLTLLFISLFFVLAVAYDVFIIMTKGKQESISAHMIRMGKKYPLIPFVLGTLIGHFYWQMNDVDIYGKCQSEVIEVQK